MSFKNLNLKCSYTSECDDLVNDFYNPVLSKAKEYDRICGYFNSTSLAIAAKGIKNFILNNGKMRLLCGVQLNEDDFNSMTHSSEINDAISDYFLKDIHSMEDEIQQNHVKLLAWMLENDFLEIKLGIIKSNGNRIGGMLHSKNGIVYDDDKNCILFCGSNNETAAGWVNNIENFKVFFSWNDSSTYMVNDIEEFNRFWNNESNSLEVLEIPEATKRGLIEIAPKSMDELEKLILSKKESKNKNKDKRELYPHQKEAIDKWFENGNQGIFEMATGTGKTFTALKALEKMFSKNDELLVVITCPYAHIVEQWSKDIENFGWSYLFAATSLNKNWKIDLKEASLKLSLGIEKKKIILTTHNSFSSDFFREILEKIKIPCFLIADEMHHIGSSSFQNGLLSSYDFRLGLSATPERYMDEEGTSVLMSYFGGSIFKFGIEEALTYRDINDKTFLTPYYYFPEKIELTRDESKEYKNLTAKIASLYNSNNKDNGDTIENLLRKRKRILNNAESKFDKLKEIIINEKNNGKIDHLIVFCSPQQIDKVKSILRSLDVGHIHKFTNDEGTSSKMEYGGISERQSLLNRFDTGELSALVAIKCLDEGVDVPSADKVIIMSSSNNPMEYVQRRGRVLRRYPGKDYAKIYDMVVVFDENLGFNNRGNEKERMFDFIKTSENSSHGFDYMKKWGMI